METPEHVAVSVQGIQHRNKRIFFEHCHEAQKALQVPFPELDVLPRKQIKSSSLWASHVTDEPLGEARNCIESGFVDWFVATEEL